MDNNTKVVLKKIKSELYKNRTRCLHGNGYVDWDDIEIVFDRHS